MNIIKNKNNSYIFIILYILAGISTIFLGLYFFTSDFPLWLWGTSYWAKYVVGGIYILESIFFIVCGSFCVNKYPSLPISTLCLLCGISTIFLGIHADISEVIWIFICVVSTVSALVINLKKSK